MGGSVTIGGILTGVVPGNTNIGPYSIAGNSSGNSDTLATTLASGANTISVPSWAVACIIIPNAANAIALTLKGVTGDTGIVIDPTGPTLLNFAASPPASFVITAASLTTTITQIVFF
jgi:hypothetical protein